MTKPNDPCTCGSGMKYKECCGVEEDDFWDDDSSDSDSGSDE